VDESVDNRLVDAYFLATALTADDTAPAASSSQGPIIVVILAVIALVGTGLTAIGPSLVEIAKNRGSRQKVIPVNGAPEPPPAAPEPTPASTQMVQSAQSGLAMIESAVMDARTQRDAVMRHAGQLRRELEEERDVIRRQAVYIAQLEGRFNNQGYGAHTAPQAPHPPQGWERR
jgi:hypothetical protein